MIETDCAYMQYLRIDTTKIHALLLDMDGVLWKDDIPIGNLENIFAKIAHKNWKVILVTNNSTKTPEQYLAKLSSFNVKLEFWQVLTSSMTAAIYLQDRHPHGGPVYIIGEQGLIDALKGCNFFQEDKNPIAVVVGMDRYLTYEKLKKATIFLRSGVSFIASNTDLTFPSTEGLIPGAGSIVAALEAASGISPTVTGKPSPNIYHLALDRLGTSPEETLVIGDRLETDIVGAQAIGCPAALVLSGVTTQEQAVRWMPPLDIIAPDLACIVNM